MKRETDRRMPLNSGFAVVDLLIDGNWLKIRIGIGLCHNNFLSIRAATATRSPPLLCYRGVLPARN